LSYDVNFEFRTAKNEELGQLLTIGAVVTQEMPMQIHLEYIPNQISIRMMTSASKIYSVALKQG
jgi:hypothetical protein